MTINQTERVSLWAPGQAVEYPKTAQELLARLASLDRSASLAGQPCLAVLATDESQRSLSVGLGAMQSVVVWTDNKDSRSSTSRRDADGENAGDDMGFWLDTAWSEFPATSGIEKNLALNLAAEFFVSRGERPQAVLWEDD